MTTTQKQFDHSEMLPALELLGFSGEDTTRLGWQILPGSQDNMGKYLENLAHSLQDCASDAFLIRSAGEDVVIYGPTGYGIVDHRFGSLEYAFPYSEGQSFESMTKLHKVA